MWESARDFWDLISTPEGVKVLTDGAESGFSANKDGGLPLEKSASPE